MRESRDNYIIRKIREDRMTEIDIYKKTICYYFNDVYGIFKSFRIFY